MSTHETYQYFLDIQPAKIADGARIRRKMGMSYNQQWRYGSTRTGDNKRKECGRLNMMHLEYCQVGWTKKSLENLEDSNKSCQHSSAAGAFRKRKRGHS